MNHSLIECFIDTRAQSVYHCEPLATEDYNLQAEAFTSPPKWHLAHTTWFFETFLLKPFLAGYQSPDEHYEMLFNSYYDSIGEQFPRPRRGLLSRPTVDQVIAYREVVDNGVLTLLENDNHPDRTTIIEHCTLGIAHEQQHQELFFTDLKYCLAMNPLFPAYARPLEPTANAAAEALEWLEYSSGLVEIGHLGNGFAFDNELPRHKTYLEPYLLASRLISIGEYQQFIDDGGYQYPEFWLADGWHTVQQHGWRQPLYWYGDQEYTLHGLQPRLDQQPVCHISGYEADAYARWAGARLPTEMEWEYAAATLPIATVGVDSGIFHPQPLMEDNRLAQLYSDCWQWTQSAYSPYPGYKAAKGAVGEYNGKFMSNQWVLRGGSCVSKNSHLRPSYRNFFYPHERWQFTGIRLARSFI